MIPEILKENERRLRKAIARRHYRDLPWLLDDLSRNAAEHRNPETAQWMRANIEWARLMVLTQRQTWAAELERLPMVNRYLDRPADPSRAVCLDL
jgi:hypothetical protein